VYSFIKNKVPLNIKRKIVLSARSVLYFISLKTTKARQVVLALSKGERRFGAKQSDKDCKRVLGDGFAPDSPSAKALVHEVMSDSSTPIQVVPQGKRNNTSRLRDRLDYLGLTVNLSSLSDTAYANAPFLIYVDSGAARNKYSEIIRLAGCEFAYILFKVKADYSEFISSLVDANLSVEDFSARAFYLPTIDSTIDDMVYNIADEYSDMLLVELAERFSNSQYLYEISSYLKFLRVTTSDRLVGWVRSVRYVQRFVESRAISRLYMYGGGGIDGNILAFCINNVISSVVQVNAAARLQVGDLNNLVSRQWQPVNRSIVTRYAMSDEGQKSSDVIFFVGNLKDPQYKETNEPVIEALASKTNKNIVVLSSHPCQLEYSSNLSIISPVLESDLFQGIDELNSIIDDVVDDFVLAGLNICKDEGLLRLYSSMNARRSLQRLLRDCIDLKGQVDKVSSSCRVSAIVSCPGRLWASQFLVGYLGDTVPTFEIQSGTLSMTTRYKKPNSKYILSVDDYSSRVYIDFLGVEKAFVEVVGAPRIDSKLSYIRTFTSADSRELVFGEKKIDKVICIATQPYGVEIMASMVEIVAEFVARNVGWVMIVSMHPNENSMYENSYRSVLASRLDFSRYVISRGNIYHNLNASSKVVTYFSTSGLEAFCLDKDVLTYRPENGLAVPFDLAELGVASPFSNIESFTVLISEKRLGGSFSEGLSRLKDGNSIGRICHAVLEAANAS